MAERDTPKLPSGVVYEDSGGAAPLVYFDIIGAFGTMNGSIELELATRILIPKQDGTTEVRFLSTGRLRCSPTAAVNLRNGLEAALKMVEQSQQPNPVAASRMN